MKSLSLPITEDSIELVRKDRARLGALHSLGLLDAPAEEDFDRLTRLAARTLKAPVAFISMLDTDRDFYLSQVGFGEATARTRVAMGRTLCHFSLVNRQTMAISDARLDPQLSHVPSVAQGRVKAYLGVPLFLGDGAMVGNFCVIDPEPHDWSEEDIESIRTFADSVERELRLREALRIAQHHLEAERLSIRQREEMVAVFSHDVRSPLTVIQMCAHVLISDKPAEIKSDAGQRIHRALDSVTSLVNEVLDAARDNSTESFARLDLCELVEDAFEMYVPIAQRHQLGLTLSQPDEAMVVRGAYGALLRVLTNLLGNAVKFTPQGQISLKLEKLERQARITLTDTGIGMSAEQMRQMYERGWQAISLDQRGSGLGLGIVREIVNAHGGRIDASSVPGEGSEFSVVLPLDQVP